MQMQAWFYVKGGLVLFLLITIAGGGPDFQSYFYYIYVLSYPDMIMSWSFTP